MKVESDIPEKWYSFLEEVSENLGVSLETLVREAVRQYLESLTSDMTPEENKTWMQIMDLGGSEVDDHKVFAMALIWVARHGRKKVAETV